MSVFGHARELTSPRSRIEASRLDSRMALVSACLGWMFDAMDLQIFTLIQFPSVSEIIGSAEPAAVAYTGGVIFAWKLAALGLGGIAFGIVADRIGRARTMIVTVLIYCAFTGLSSLAQTWWQLATLQALAGIGIGGEWAAGAALVAETWPEQSRPRALIVMQMSFAAGFFLAAALNLLIGPIGWCWVLAAGAAPAVTTLFIRRFVREPERWIAARRVGTSPADNAFETAAGKFVAIFAPAIRRRTIVGVLVAAAMMIGAFGGASLLPIWIVQLAGHDRTASVAVTSQSIMLANIGAVLGYVGLLGLVNAIGRRWSYFLTAAGCTAVSLILFTRIATVDGLLWFAPVYGLFVIGGFGTFATYLPELFPTRIRATGPGFCWNTARALTAVGPLTTATLVGALGSVAMAGIAVAAIYVVGAIAIWFGPETKDVPLQD
jgi:MFS family permease